MPMAARISASSRPVVERLSTLPSRSMMITGRRWIRRYAIACRLQRTSGLSTTHNDTIWGCFPKYHFLCGHRPPKTDASETTPLRHFQKTSTFVIGLSILIYDSDTDFIRINNQFTCIGAGGLVGRKTTDWIRVGISAINSDHAVDWPYHYALV